MTGNASTRAVGMSAANEPKSPTPMGGASVSEVLAADIDHGSNFAESIWEAVQMYGPRDLTKLEKSQMADAVTNAAVEWVMARNQAHQASNPTAEGK